MNSTFFVENFAATYQICEIFVNAWPAHMGTCDTFALFYPNMCGTGVATLCIVVIGEPPRMIPTADSTRKGIAQRSSYCTPRAYAVEKSFQILEWYALSGKALGLVWRLEQVSPQTGLLTGQLLTQNVCWSGNLYWNGRKKNAAKGICWFKIFIGLLYQLIRVGGKL